MVASVFNRFAPIDFTRYIDRLTDRFTGREWLFEQIDGWLQQGNEQFYLLTGEPGVGKSAIAAQLTQLRNDIAAYHFCRAADVETLRPGRVLRSLAAQLGKTLPHYGEALAKTIDPIHLRIEVNINIESLSNSQLTGIYIENLKQSDPKDELEILLRAPLAALPDLYAERGEPLPTLKVLLIDSLDEAVFTTGNDNMANLLATLSQAEGLPPWIRFILTARPDLRVLQQFRSARLYKLEELLAQNLEDIERYLQRRVQELTAQPELEFQTRLEQAQLSTETLVHEVKDHSKGNFLYTRLVVDGIAIGELSLKNLSALPRTLNEVYQRFLRNRCPFRKWIARYQPILGTLTVTQEAISRERLVKFVGIDSQQIQDALDVLHQFLDEVENEQGQKVYAIFHQSLREFLLDKKHNQDFWCDIKEQHDTIISCYEKESESWQELRQIDPYGLRYLAQHLVQADRASELHTLLSLEKDGRNAWFEAHQEFGNTATYSEQVELAWQQADADSETSHFRIGLQCRYALMKASLNSLAINSLPELLIKLVQNNFWSPQKGLDYALQHPNSLLRQRLIICLIDVLPSNLKEKALQEALNAVREIDESNRVFALPNLVPKLPLDLLPEVLNATREIQDESYRTDTIVALTSKLPSDLLPEALNAAREIQNNNLRAYALAILTSKLPSDFLTEEVVNGAREIPEPRFRAEALTALTNTLPHLLPEALNAAREIPEPRFRAEALTALVDKHPEVLHEALNAAREIPSYNLRVYALAALANKLPSGLLPEETLNAAREIPEARFRAEALTALIDKYPEVLPEALNAARNIPEARSRAETLTILIDKYPEVLPEALNAAKDILEPSFRAEALTALINKHPEVLHEALNTARKIPDALDRIKALVALVDYRPDLLPEALNAAKEIDDDKFRTNTSNFLTYYDPSLYSLQKFLSNCINMVQSDRFRTNALAALGDKLRQVLPEKLNAAREIEDYNYCAKVLADLVDKKLAFNSLPNTSRPHKSPFDRDDLEYYKYYANTLADLAPKLPSSLLLQAIRAATEIKDNFYRATTLTAFADKHPEVLPEAFKAAMEIQEKFFRTHVLVTLVHKITDKPTERTLSQLFHLWKDVLHKSSLRNRIHLADDLKVLVPVIFALGSKKAVDEVVNAIQDVGRWWS